MARHGVIGKTVIRFGKKVIYRLDQYYARASSLGDHEFFDTGDFPWVNAVEADWLNARAELDALLRYSAHLPKFKDISADQGSITKTGEWKTYFFYAYGMKGSKSCRRCPKTVELLKRMPGMKTAFFSILEPGTHLPPHRGPYKGVLRLHLGLVIPGPEEKCGIRVGSETRHWQEGKVMIFDDTFQHEAWNRTDKTRVVLFVDIMRPMRFPANLLNSFMTWIIALSPLVLGAAGNYLRWERRFEAVVNQTD